MEPYLTRYVPALVLATVLPVLTVVAIASQDLLAALRFAVQPEDELNLAALLVSPLIGWTQDDLMVRLIGRKTGLWRHLNQTLDEHLLKPLRQPWLLRIRVVPRLILQARNDDDLSQDIVKADDLTIP